ncbi:MAG: 2,3-bisphosphoglycerate-independent phosphoglycerate mutase [Pseudomonadota bacterium]
MSANGQLGSSSNDRTTTALIILDGWGQREEQRDNAIALADTPTWDQLWAKGPRTLLDCSGLAVGLPPGQFGNSEVGHMCLGAGRVLFQSITRIDQAIDDGSFYSNPAYTEAVDCAVNNGNAVHVLGLLSQGGVHSHERHLMAALKLAADRGANRLYLHCFLDGRDTPPQSAGESLSRVQDWLDELGVGRIASVVGRYYAMDRDHRWERVQEAYDLLTLGLSEFTAQSAQEALQLAYDRGENDEFVRATRVGDASLIETGDAVLFMNFRADRARQLSHAFLENQFDGFERRSKPELAGFAMTTEYAPGLNAACAFPPIELANVLGDWVSKQGCTQFRLAETEKYAHVTFFFSGGREDEFVGETRVLVPSPDVATYDLKPSMSAVEVTDELIKAIKSGKQDLIICNYANCDMVGHTGSLHAAVEAAETVDSCLARVVAAIGESGAQVLITADHGNCEQMLDYDTGQAHTQHTTNQVPLVYLGDRQLELRDGGGLADIAPTLLALLELEQPSEMNGRSLIANEFASASDIAPSDHGNRAAAESLQNS